MTMWIYCAYVGCFAVASVMTDNAPNNFDEGKGEGSTTRKTLVIIGGVLGGIGGGFLCTAQGTYLTRVSVEYAAASNPNIYGRLQTSWGEFHHDVYAGGTHHAFALFGSHNYAKVFFAWLVVTSMCEDLGLSLELRLSLGWELRLGLSLDLKLELGQSLGSSVCHCHHSRLYIWLSTFFIGFRTPQSRRVDLALTENTFIFWAKLTMREFS